MTTGVRTFRDGSSVDSTAAALAYLASNSQPIIYTFIKIDLAVWLDSINAPFGGSITPSYLTKQFLLTDCPAAVTYTPIGVFKSAIVKHGPMSFELGIDFKGFEVTWTPSSTDLALPANQGAFVATPSISIQQGIAQGIFDGAYISVYKVLMPTQYDANTIGCCLVHAGAVDEMVVKGKEITFKVNSVINQQDQQIPSQLIAPSSRFASLDPVAYVGISTASFGGAHDAIRWPDFQADTARPQSASLLTSANFADILFCPASGFFDGGFVVWTSGPLIGVRRAIAHSTSDVPGGIITFQLAQPFPFDATLYSSGHTFGFSFDAYTRRSSMDTDSLYNGFPNVPNPQDAI